LITNWYPDYHAAGIVDQRDESEVERGTTMPPKVQPNDEPIPGDAAPKPKAAADSEVSSEKIETVSAE
jgi:hypothetical protein